MIKWLVNLFKSKPEKLKPFRYSVSKKGYELIKKFEGYREQAYLCSANVWTIGYGSTEYAEGTKVLPGDMIGRQVADDLLRLWVKINIESVLHEPELLILKLKQSQIDALASIIYNIGVGAFKKSTLRHKLINGEPKESVALEFLRWNKYTDPDTGKLQVLEGLDRRRKAEYALFLS